ncbi:Hsp20/alpha crystallin family protein [Rariglobus hedericola]|uniref:Hsp20/alpha crystallin family protein n=1 Tax=Rariglobus hedericola TaxID=2597822 RepID=A0A556QRE6_9BACT|nr:Hsp20/alpha crystallin family protein [Rariglobus hedericola]TSJ79202.1 Hsp20/alpha crystallin family protein [Rariglobus hedericola]
MRFVRYTYPSARNVNFFNGAASRGLENEVDRLFNTALGNFSDRGIPVDLYEDKDNTYVRAELPGVDREAITVEHADGRLSISASRQPTAPQAGDKSAEPVTFTRNVSVPDQIVQADKISAAYENGVLTVTLPKREETKPRKVSVTVA